jgi:RNA polymerase sigma-70 factor (ECF subfamily)
MGDDFERIAQAGAHSRRDMDEREAVKASQKGDRTAFGHLIDRYYQDLYRFACQSTGSPPDADDICQEAFFRAFDRIRSLRNGRSFKAWIYKITLNLVRKRRSSRGRGAGPGGETPVADDPPAPAAVALDILGEEERAGRIREEIAGLPEDLRLITILVLMDGMTQKEAALVVGCSEATASRRLETARDLLRTRLRHLVD